MAKPYAMPSVEQPVAENTLWPQGFAAWIKVGACYHQGSRKLANLLRPIGLTVAQFDALATLYVADGISQKELAERLLVTKGNVTGLVERLMAHGFVTRRADPRDRRAYRLHLTRVGINRARRGLEIQRELITRVIAVLDAGEQETLRELLSRVTSRLEQEET